MVKKKTTEKQINFKKVILEDKAMKKLSKYKQLGEFANGVKEPFLKLTPNKMLQCVICLIDNNFEIMKDERKELTGSYKELLNLFKQIGISIEDKQRLSDHLSKFTKLCIEEKSGFEKGSKKKAKYEGFMLFQKWVFDENEDYFSLVLSDEFHERIKSSNYFAVRDINTLQRITTNGVFILIDMIMKDYNPKTKKSYFKVEGIKKIQLRFNDKKRWVDFKRYILEPSLQRANVILQEKLKRPFWYKIYKKDKAVSAIEIVPWENGEFVEGDGYRNKAGKFVGTPLYCHD